MTRLGAMTTVAALLGIVLTAAIAWSTSQLAGQRIGLSAEPLSVANRLAPAPEQPEASQRPASAAKHAQPRGAASSTSTPALAPATLPSTSTSAAVLTSPAALAASTAAAAPSSTAAPAPSRPPRGAHPGEDGAHQPSGGGGSGGGGRDD